MLAKIHLKPQGTHRILGGHPWVYASEIGRIEGEAADGDEVEIRAPRGGKLGSGLYNSRSQITVRRYSAAVEKLDAGLLERRIREAVRYRERLGLARTAKRLVWSESDALPGLVVDQYGEVLSVQVLTLGMARRQELVLKALEQLFPGQPILLRNDAPVRRLEGLELEVRVAVGSYRPPTAVACGGVVWEVDLLAGQKTGFYLDQLENYGRVAAHAPGRRILDCFTNQGGFLLTALKAGGGPGIGVDQSAEALARAGAAAERAGLAGAEWRQANVFDLLPGLERAGERFGLVVLDPPSFTKSKARLEAALRGYKELHLRAMKLLERGGLLATFCCSHHVGSVEWEAMLREAAGDAGVSLRRRETFGQAADHPVLLEVPETEYLRGSLFERV